VNEFDIIQRFFAGKITLQKDHVLIGPGDDCAVLAMSADQELCVSTDTFVEGVHFPFGAEASLIISRLMAANLSDLAAMGAEPYGFTLAITSPEFTEQWLVSFSDRLEMLVNTYDIPLIGGNLSRGPLSLTINIMGTVPLGRAILRSKAKVDDDIYVSGYLGEAAGGLALLDQPYQESYAPLLSRYSAPEPRLSLGTSLRNMATSAIDISDGFAADLGHLIKASGLGAQVDLEAIPLSSSLVTTFGLDIARLKAVQGGDDYELCFTAMPKHEAKIKELSLNLDLKLTKVGKICLDQELKISDKLGRAFSETEGYQHF